MKCVHTSISFCAKNDEAVAKINERLNGILRQSEEVGEISAVSLEVQEEIIGAICLPAGVAVDEIPGDLEFDDIFVPNTEEF